MTDRILLQALPVDEESEDEVATMTTPGLRRQIVALLASALRDPRSQRSVWRWRGAVWRWLGDDITEDGTLDRHFYRALLRVAGFRVE